MLLLDSLQRNANIRLNAEDAVGEVVSIFRYLQNKDIFADYYRQLLAQVYEQIDSDRC